MSLVWAFAVGVVGVVLFVAFSKRVGHRGLPGFVERPVLGAALDVKVDELPAKFVNKLRAEKFAPLSFSVFGQTLFISCDAQDAEFMLSERFEAFEKGVEFFEVFEELLGTGIFATDGAVWSANRKAASHLFSTGKLKKFQAEVFHKDAHMLADLLAETNGREIDLQPFFYSITFDSFCDLAFGVSFDATKEVARTNTKPAFQHSFDELTRLAGNRFFRPLWKLQRLLNVGDEA